MDNNANASNGASIEQRKAGKKPLGLKDVNEQEIVKDMEKYDGVAIDCVLAEFKDNVKGKDMEGSNSGTTGSDGSTQVTEVTSVGQVGSQHLEDLKNAIMIGQVVTISAKGKAKTASKDKEETENEAQK